MHGVSCIPRPHLSKFHQLLTIPSIFKIDDSCSRQIWFNLLFRDKKFAHLFLKLKGTSKLRFKSQFQAFLSFRSVFRRERKFISRWLLRTTKLALAITWLAGLARSPSARRRVPRRDENFSQNFQGIIFDAFKFESKSYQNPEGGLEIHPKFIQT